MDDSHLAFVADEEVVGKHAKWRYPDLKSRLDSTQSSVAGGVGATIYPWVAEESNRVLDQELTEDEGKLHGDLAGVAKGRELEAWK